MINNDKYIEEAKIVYNILLRFRLQKKHILDFLEEDKKVNWRKLLRREISYIQNEKYKDKAKEYRKRWYEKHKDEFLKKQKEKRDLLKNIDKSKSDKLKKMLLKRLSIQNKESL